MKLPTTLVLKHPDIYRGDINDTEGHRILRVHDLWCLTDPGKLVSDAREEANAGRQAIAAEVVLRWNLHEEMVALLRDLLDSRCPTPTASIESVLKKLDQP